MLGINIRSISWKIVVLFIILTIITIATFVFIIFENQMDLIKNNMLLEGKDIANRLKINVEKVLVKVPKNDEILAAQMKTVLENSGIKQFSLFDDEGTLIGEDRAPTSNEIEYFNKAVYKYNFENKFFYHNIITETQAIEFYIPITYGKNRMIVVKPIMPVTVEKDLNALYRQCFIVAGIVILIYLLFVLLLNRMVVSPLKTLNAATVKISQGDFESKVKDIDERDDEIGALAQTFNAMGVKLDQMRDEARDANALTHLPGNAMIMKELNNRIQANLKFAIIYIDLDNFKAYNDKYGFTMGDEAIFYLCDKLKQTVEEVGLAVEDFIGHEGGDDFVMIVNPDRMKIIASTLIEHFDGGIKQFYNEEDAKRECIMSVTRDGEKKEFPLMSISCAIVTNLHRHFVHHSEVIKVASEMKKKVKAIDGSVYMVDQRTH